MDWMQFAVSDWEVYGDPYRIGVYTEKGKITPEQYEEITGEPYNE
jgi:hypothetical protein